MILLNKKIPSSLYNKYTGTLTLNHKTRSKRRSKVYLDDGRLAYFKLTENTIMRGGDFLIDIYNKEIIKIISAKEKISLASCNNILFLLKACFHLGNRHVLLEINKNEIKYLFDPVLDNMLAKIGITVKHVLLPFEPEAGAYLS